MKIIRLANSKGIEYIKEHFVDDDASKEFIAEGLKTSLINNLENTFILLAFEGDKVIAYLTAMNMVNFKYVWLDQVWSDKDTPPDVNDKIFFRFLMWVDSLGKTEIRMETKRDEDAITRKWKFEKHSTIMKFILKEDYEKGYLNSMRKEEVEVKTNDAGIIPTSNETNKENK